MVWSAEGWLHPLLHIEELKAACGLETRVDSPEAHPLGLCWIPGLLVGQLRAGLRALHVDTSLNKLLSGEPKGYLRECRRQFPSVEVHLQ